MSVSRKQNPDKKQSLKRLMFTHDTFQWPVQFKTNCQQLVIRLKYDVRTVNEQLKNLLPYPPTHPPFVH